MEGHSRKSESFDVPIPPPKEIERMGLQLHAHFLSASSRTVLTFLEANPEVKVDVIEKDLSKMDELQKKEYLEFNPVGRLPFLIDGHEHFKLWGPVPTVLYLEEKHGPSALSEPLIPVDLKAKAKVHQWCAWYYHTIGPKVGEYVNRVFIGPIIRGESKPKEEEVMRLTRGVDHAITELERCFPEGSKWLVSAVPGVDQEVYSLADVRVAQKLVMLEPTPYPINDEKFKGKYPKVHRWLEHLKGEPAFQRANEKWYSFLEPLDPMLMKRAGA